MSNDNVSGDFSGSIVYIMPDVNGELYQEFFPVLPMGRSRLQATDVFRSPDKSA